MSNRLAEKLVKASGAAKRITETIEARADALIARESALGKRTDEVFVPHEAILTDAEKGLDAAEAALRLVSNNPLQGSGESPQADLNGNHLGLDPVAYRKFEAGMPLEAAKAVNGS